MPNKRPTREDVAREAGTSVAVVTYTVNNGPRPVAPHTRARVLAAIKKLGYQPNRAARALAMGKTGTYGLILPNITNPFISEIAHAVQARVHHEGYTLLLGDSADDPARERRFLEQFFAHQVDGIFYMGTTEKLAFDLLSHSPVRVVVFEDSRLDGRFPSVQIDEALAVQQLTEHLQEHGHEHIAMMTGPDGIWNSHLRLRGWCQATGYDADSALVTWQAYSRFAGYQWLMDAHERGALPTALITGNERQAVGVLAACADLGMRVPEDMAIVAVNGSSHSGFTVPSLTSIRQPLDAMANQAFALLHDPDLAHDTQAHVFDFDIVTGQSCGCISMDAPSRHAIASWRTHDSGRLDSVAGL
ncbi:LacI family DNA-binding transcriptional regulator [Schaalia sp. lx-100]|uniref:LacI family DNA-binding transcriptional regulator n=1 Tax=Schaalia sp. lx-100 TaxID=2899081 RepID=UPI001E5C7477|nr:LacI family DNA-binding transcriptional regulator [Schaalia sp. lx-100]MCD4557571.1 LacI family transcriptional regulator [Schaalia sp. lx-100]